MQYKNKIQKIKYTMENNFTESLVFRKLAKNDIFPLFSATKNEDFNKFVAWKKPNELKELVPQIEKLIRQEKIDEIAIYSICDKESGAWLGIMKFVEFEKDKNEVEISLWLKMPVEFKLGELLEFIKESLIDSGLLKAYARCMPENKRSRMIIRHCGFEIIGNIETIHESGEKLNPILLMCEREKITLNENRVMKNYEML